MKLLGALFAAVVAWWFARALGVPVWTTWEAGDRCDIALLTFAAVCLLSGRAR